MSQPGSTVCSMAPLMPTCDAGGRYARERRAARRSDRAGAFFHNPAITLLVLRRLRASHQVLRFSARRDRDADVEQRPKAKSPLGSRTADQRTTGDWKRSQNRPMPHSGPAVRSGRQPFTGAGHAGRWRGVRKDRSGASRVLPRPPSAGLQSRLSGARRGRSAGASKSAPGLTQAPTPVRE